MSIDYSKLEIAGWFSPIDGAAYSKLEVAAWQTPPDGVDYAKLEVAAWMRPPDAADYAKLEVGPWLSPADGTDFAKFEVGMWLEPTEVPMSLLVYPVLKGLAFPEKWMPRFYNMATATSASGADIDLGLAEYPLHDFELNYQFLRDSGGLTEFKTLMGFVLAIGGTKGRFRYQNPDDHLVTAQPIGIGDASTHNFVLVRSFGVGDYVSIEPVGYVDLAQAFHVYFDSVLQDPAGYLVDQTEPVNQIITFESAPGDGVVITVDMTFQYYCKLADNTEEFDKFADRIWSVGKITLHSCRPGA
jgi:hypothetical protein